MTHRPMSSHSHPSYELHISKDQPTEVELECYEDGFEDGYHDFLEGLPCAFEIDETDYEFWSMWRVLGVYGQEIVPVAVRWEDMWYTLGVLRGWEQAQEDHAIR